MNIIFRELERWRGMTGSGGIGVDNADGASPPRLVDHRASPLVPAQLAASLATGSIASPSSAAITLLTTSASGPGLTATGGTAGFTVYNFWPLAATLPSGTNILAFSFAGKLYLLQVGC